jgi:hypothetical protein
MTPDGLLALKEKLLVGHGGEAIEWAVGSK